MQMLRLPPCRAKIYDSDSPVPGCTSKEFMVKTIIAGQVEEVSRKAEARPSVGWALASLALSVLLSSLGTSIANVALPNLAEAFTASFQEVQWIVIAYLLEITTLIVSA